MAFSPFYLAGYLVPVNGTAVLPWPMDNGPWFDFSLTAESQPSFRRRLAGRLDTGSASIIDPAMEGFVLGEQSV